MRDLDAVFEAIAIHPLYHALFDVHMNAYRPFGSHLVVENKHSAIRILKALLLRPADLSGSQL